LGHHDGHHHSPGAPVVQALQALRGVQWIVAPTVVAELGDLTRFDSPAT